MTLPRVKTLFVSKFYSITGCVLLAFLSFGCAVINDDPLLVEEKEKENKPLFTPQQQEPSAIDIEHERNEVKRTGPGELRGLLKWLFRDNCG